MRALLLALTLILPGLLSPFALADGPALPALMQLIDYVGVDYAEAVQDGVIIDEDEYAEMEEFTALILTGIEGLAQDTVREQLTEQARQLRAAIEDRAEADRVARLTQAMRQQMMAHYDLVLTPRQVPDLARGARLYQAECASCHGMEGRGEGPLSAGLDPEPTDFHEIERARQRSLYGLYNTITLGVPGTAMVAYGQLSDAERWDLAFHVGGLHISEDLLRAGAASWRDGSLDLRSAITASPAELAEQIHGGEVLAAWLRHHPEALFAGVPQPLEVAEQQLRESLQRARDGDFRGAEQAAITAYLEGFELAEAALTNLDRGLVQEVERAMMDYRQLLRRSAPLAAIEPQYDRVRDLLAQSREQLEGAALSPAVAFLTALIILLREGLEAILVVVAMLTLLTKTGRRQALSYVHAGWMAALLAGLGTWALSNWVIGISGATREMTEGFTALLAAAMLFYIGYWMHRQSRAGAWHQFLQGRLEEAMGRRSLWTLTLIAFLAVYREVFETVLFYQALWVQAGEGARQAIWGGAGTAAVLLLIGGWLLARLGMKLPLRRFFAVSAWLLLLLAIIFAGKGIAALQEAGTLPHDRVALPTIGWLGLYPSLQGVGTQIVLLALALGLLLAGRRRDRE